MASEARQVIGTVEGTTRPLRPESIAADGSARFKCIGGPANGGMLRLYPPFDEPVYLDRGHYELRAGTGRAVNKDRLFYVRKEQ